MEQQRFIIVNKILGELVYDLPLLLKGCPICEKAPETSIDTNVSVRKRDVTDDYVVEIDVTVTEGIQNRWIKKQVDFRIRLGFLVIVKVEEGMNEENIAKMLETEVPKSVVSDIQTLITDLSSHSGLPPVFLDVNIFDEIKHISRQSSAPTLGYEWLLNNISSSPEGSVFLRTLIEAFGASCLDYKQSPLYRYFYRFLKPIKYSHPHFDECKEKFWDFLFQLIFAESDTVDIIETKDGIPEISFSYEDHKKIKTSSLTLDQVKEITSDLGTLALTNTMVKMFGTNINREYGDTLSDNAQLFEWEIRKLYNYSPDDIDNARVEFFNSVCSRYKRYADLTFQYHLRNES